MKSAKLVPLHYLIQLKRETNLVLNHDLEDAAKNGKYIINQDQNVPHIYKLQLVAE